MKLVLAVDSSPATDDVLGQVIARPWPQGTVARLLNVVDSRAFASGFVDVETYFESETAAVRALLMTLAERLTAAGIEAVPVVVDGYPRTKIVEYAAGWGADLIVVGSHGHTALARFFLGSTARYVTRHAGCSVEIVRAPRKDADAPLRILLASDGSACSVAAARSVASRPWPRDTTILVASAVDMAVPAIEPWYAAPDLVARIEKEALAGARQAVSDAARIIRDAGLAVSEITLSGNPKAMLVDQAKDWHADLVVVGSHGRHGLDRAILGSVSESIAMHAHCSVEVIRG